MKDTKIKKELGVWGEKTLDNWLKLNNWEPIQKNLKIKKGEIDRIYIKNSQTQKVEFCLAEVKTSLLQKKEDIFILYTETGVKRYLKQRQIQNLYRCGENLIATLKQKNHINFNVYLRIFIILKSLQKIDKNFIYNLPKSSAIKSCYSSENHLIFCIEPEFTKINSRKSLLQTTIY